jgi:nitronate monooxygenase
LSASRLPPFIAEQTTLPLIAAPMFLVLGPELVLAACQAGVIGSFPAPNARSAEILDAWMGRIVAELDIARAAEPSRRIAPWAANIVVHRFYRHLRQHAAAEHPPRRAGLRQPEAKVDD